ncbi:MAG: zinc dependent phospholipase C family protein [Roseburia sp.]
MRKKSHISLARYMVNTLGDENLKKHKFSFYLGSILPDIKPSFLYKRHEITGTFPQLQREMEKLAEGKKHKGKKGCGYFRDLGQVSHYLADYFTFPHNKIFSGSLKEHCSYEEKLKKDLRSYLKKKEFLKEEQKELKFRDTQDLFSFIQKSHNEYIDKKHDVAGDIQHIVEINHKAIQGLMDLWVEKRAEHFLQHS